MSIPDKPALTLGGWGGEMQCCQKKALTVLFSKSNKVKNSEGFLISFWHWIFAKDNQVTEACIFSIIHKVQCWLVIIFVISPE